MFDEFAAAELDTQTGELGFSGGTETDGVGNVIYGAREKLARGQIGYGDEGGASRFFYVAKASTEERELGCDAMPEVRRTDGRTSERHVPNLRTTYRRNHHPTVKPIDLMRHLIKLVTPPGGIVLDPFMGSGSTGCAAVLDEFRFIGFDMTPEYIEIAKARIKYWKSTLPASLF